MVGLYGYGGDVTRADGRYSVIPKDGVRQRLTFYTEGGLQVGLEGSRYTAATVAKDLSDISLTLENRRGTGAYSPMVSLGHLPGRDYRVSVDGVTQDASVTSDGSATVSLDLRGASHVVQVRVVPPDATAPSVTVRSGSKFTVGSDGLYRKVSFTLADDGKVDRYTLNGVATDVADAVSVDVDGIVPGRHGAVGGKNTLEVFDVAGNATTVEFTLDSTGPKVVVKPDNGLTSGKGGVYSKISFVLSDPAEVDTVEINGTVTDLADAVSVDMDGVRKRRFGAVKGENTLVAFDTLGNSTTFTFTLR